MGLEQIRTLLAASEEVRFEGENRKEIYNWVRQTVIEQQYHVQGKADKGLLRRYVAKMTGLSRAQLTRLIGQYLETGKIEERGYRRRRFPSLYTRKDIELLGTVDEAHETLSGPARQKILYREYQELGNAEYERLAAPLGGAPLQSAQDGHVSKTADRLSGDPAHAGAHRREAEAGPAGSARIPAGGHGTPGRPRRSERSLSPQCGG